MKLTKYALTGHTSGIGKRLYELLSPGVQGFSLSTGYDITLSQDRRRVIDQVQDCDVFINNACAGFAQTQLYIELLQQWRDQDKIIINVGSRIAELEQLPYDRLNLMSYQAEKVALKEMSYRTPAGIKCQVRYRWFGYVGTDRILSKYPHFTASDYITVDRACEIILS